MDLFENDLFSNSSGQYLHITDGAMLLRHFVQLNKNALFDEAGLLADLSRILESSPVRHIVTPGGFTMSVAMTNCGTLGWVIVIVC
jgi:alkylated DNA repair protein (DNA oxidative demethylase)